MRAAFYLLISTAVAGAPAAFAQNVQYQSGDSTAVTDIEAGWAHDAGATAVASGNVVTSNPADDDHDLESSQHMDGDTSATADATVWSASGNVAITSAAVSNGGTVSITDNAVELEAEQLAHGDAAASAALTNGYASNAAVSASASNNTGAVSAEHAEVRLLTDQDSTGSVSTDVSADLGVIEDQAVSGAIASANNLSAGGETATILTDTRQTATGANVSARSDLYVGYATNASGNATANANAVTIDNQWGYVNAAIDQFATSDVSADSFVTLGGDFTGFASAGAYGVGNQAMVSNVGSDTVMDVTQANGGDVSANVALSGDGGGMALASSAAYGNSVTGSLCSNCDLNVPGLSASSDQSNDGDVYSSSTIHTTGAVTVGATSTAIGNAATYQVSTPGG